MFLSDNRKSSGFGPVHSPYYKECGSDPDRVLPAPSPSVLVIGFLFWSGDGAGCMGGAPDGVLRGSLRA